MSDSQNKPSVLIVGLGKIGLKVANSLSASFSVYGLKRTPVPVSSDIKLICADLSQPEQLRDTFKQQLPNKIDYLLYCLTPSTRDEEGYRKAFITNFENLLTSMPLSRSLKHLFFVSSSSVYHQNDCSDVDEESLCQPVSYAGKILLEAEALVSDKPIPSSIIRFSGIYGGTRTHLIKQVQNAANSNEAILSKQIRLTNRIHEDDCAGFLSHLINKSNAGDQLEALYLASDSCPVDLNQVINYIAETYDWQISSERADINTRRGGNKKCNNSRMLASTYQLKFPSYKEGYAKD